MGESTFALRLKPGDDLKDGIQQFVNANSIRAGWIVGCVGSLTEYHLRFANQEQGLEGSGHFEIVSLTGTLSVNGCHLHASISDGYGHTIGGHLLSGCKVYTTAEIILTATDKYIFMREHDDTTGWKELKIEEP
ncbi:MAG TPA: PPC domain-containing DNA-binding protein [Chitinophagaceae bacterium]|nr:PPC domain-containing DNA-binding protein [Chitinophagaceae bacterium]